MDLSSIATEIFVSLASALVIFVVGWVFRRNIAQQLHSWFFRQLGMGVEAAFTERIQAQKDVEKNLGGARTIRLMGVQGITLFSKRMARTSSVGQAAFEYSHKELAMRFLLLDPNSEFVVQRSEELSIGHTAEDIRQGILHTVDDVKLLAKQTENTSVELRVYDSPPIWSLIFLDDLVYVSTYTKGVPGFASRCYRIRAKRGSLYWAFDKYFNYMWSAAKQIDE